MPQPGEWEPVTSKILIVDDHSDLRKLVRMTLAVEAYELAEATNADQARERLSTEPANLVILDVMMPGGVDGVALCRELRESSDRTIRVILLSAKGQQADIERGMAAGAAAYLVKPFSPTLLLDTVRDVLRRPPD